MIERNEIAYISPTKCLSRQQELVGNKPEKEIQLDASKTALVIKEQPLVAEINISSDLALYQALLRRTRAMDLTGLASFEVMKRRIDRMFAFTHNRLTWISEGEPGPTVTCRPSSICQAE